MAVMLVPLNTLPLGHVEKCDCYPVHHWRVTSLYIFLHAVVHTCVSWSVSLITSRLLTAWCGMFGSQVTNRQTGP